MERELTEVIQKIEEVVDQREQLLCIYRKVELHLTCEEQALLFSSVEYRRTHLTDRYYELLGEREDLIRKIAESRTSLQT